MLSGLGSGWGEGRGRQGGGEGVCSQKALSLSLCLPRKFTRGRYFPDLFQCLLGVRNKGQMGLCEPSHQGLGSKLIVCLHFFISLFLHLRQGGFEFRLGHKSGSLNLYFPAIRRRGPSYRVVGENSMKQCM